MKRIICLLLILCSLSAFVSCQGEVTENEVTENTKNSDSSSQSQSRNKWWNVPPADFSDEISTEFYMKSEYEEYDQGVEEIKFIFGRKDGDQFHYGERYVIYKEINGEWEMVEFSPEYYYGGGLCFAEKEDQYQFVSRWIIVRSKNFKNELTHGRYRAQMEFDDGCVFCEFTIK